ncbi:MAG: hypothetical protein PHR35_05440 [Kiritimatiellae bacterium]|nr:hypothetical protein [Kiritimatiellia bacterium]
MTKRRKRSPEVGPPGRLPLTPRVGVVSLASPLEVGADRAPRAAADLARVLTRAGCEVVNAGQVTHPDRAVAAGRKLSAAGVDVLAVVLASWCEDYLLLDLLEECGRPVLLWSLPGVETGALCGAQQLKVCLRHLGVAGASVFGAAHDPECLAQSMDFLRGAALARRMRRARIGIVGHHVNGMTHTAVNEMELKRTLGPRVVWLDVPSLLQRAAAAPAARVRELWRQVVGSAGRCEVRETAGLESMRLYVAIKETCDEHGLNAVAFGCYPDLMGRACLAGSLLADDGIPMACEGDVHGAVGQYLLWLLTGQPTHSTDWLDPADANSVIFTHCGSGSFALAERRERIRLAPVRLAGKGVCALFTTKPGPVTLVNITAARAGGYQCAVLEGEAVPTEMVFPGNPVRVRFAQPVRLLMDWINAEALGHHWSIGHGHCANILRAWSSVAGVLRAECSALSVAHELF